MVKVDYSVKQQFCRRRRICGDTFAFRRLGDSGSFKAVLCDGLGHGVKANILANITMRQVLEFDFERGTLDSLAKEILSVQPICEVRHISHSTYTLIHYDALHSMLHIINYDNPLPLLFTLKGEPLEVEWSIEMVENYVNRPKRVQRCSFRLEQSLLFMMYGDGVSQSGVGGKYTFGWGERNVAKFVQSLVEQRYTLSDIAVSVVNESLLNENNFTHDDISFVAISIEKIE